MTSPIYIDDVRAELVAAREKLTADFIAAREVINRQLAELTALETYNSELSASGKDVLVTTIKAEAEPDSLLSTWDGSVAYRPESESEPKI